MRSGPKGATLSDDGHWWWDGVRWRPAVSPDGKWRFDGHVWRRTNAWRRPPLGVLIASAIWAAAIALWAPITVMLSHDPAGDVGPGATGRFGAVALGMVIATAMLGLVLGLTTQLRWTWLTAAVGTCMQMAGYVVMMLGAPQPGGVEDDAAAVGLLILSMPILLAVTGLLWIGAGTGLLVRTSRQRFGRRPSRPQVAETDCPRLPG